MKRMPFYILQSIFVLAFIISGCGRPSDSGKKEDAIPVKVMKVRAEDVSKTLEYVGDIKGQDEAIVYPKVTGKIVEKVREEGSAVAKGDVIAYVDRDEVGFKFEKAPIESPLSGTVGRIYVDLGSNVTMETPIALIADMEKAEIDLDVPEIYLPRIAIGQRAAIRVSAYPDEIFTGIVTNISPIVDLQTRSAPIEIVIENAAHKLRSGMFAKVDLVIEDRRDAPAILKEAVIGRIEPVYVYVIELDRAHLRQVKLGLRKGPYVEVVDGLKIGDTIVIMGQQKLRDGALVAAEE